MNISQPTMFRAIGVKMGSYMDSFTDCVVLPEILGGDLPDNNKVSTVADIPRKVVLSTFCNHDQRGNPSVVVNIDSIITDALTMVVVRRTLNGPRLTEFKPLRTMLPISSPGTRKKTYQIADNGVLPGETYEYRCKFTDPSGVEYISSQSAIETPKRATAGASFSVTDKSNTPQLLSSSKAYITKFTLSPIMESSYMSILEGMVKSRNE
jgi:hypothetical protein